MKSARNQIVTFMCANCNSKNLTKRKNFSHGSKSKSKTSYSCKDCGSSKVTQERSRGNFRK